MLPRLTTSILAEDAASGFSCGVRELDDFFARHAVRNQVNGIGSTYVYRRAVDETAELPKVLGFYTLSMASVESSQLTLVLPHWLPRYPMPAALIGRFAVDRRAQGRGIGEQLLVDVLHRIVDAAAIIACTGAIVDAKTPEAERFYAKYDFVALSSAGWPRRMFIPIGTVRAALS